MIETIGTNGSSDSTLEQLAPLATALSGAVALLGVWLGSRLQRRSGEAAWLKDRRIEAYSVFLDEYHKAGVVTNDLMDEERRGRALRELDVEMFGFERPLDRIRLVGTEEVAAAARGIASVLSELARKLRDDPGADIGNIMRRGADVEEAFFAAAIRAVRKPEL